MTAFNVFLKEVTENTWTAEGGTAIEVMGREVVEPTQPATAKLLKSTTIAQKVKAKLSLPGALVTELEAGAKVVALTVHLNAKATAEEKRIKFGTESPAVTSEPLIPIAQTWLTVAFSKAQAEAQTKTTLEALVLLVEHVKANSASLYELYVSLETEGGGSTVKPKVEIVFKQPDVMGALQTQKPSPVSRLTWGFEAAPLVLSLAAFQSRFALNATATASLVHAASPTSKLVLGEKLTAKQAQAVVPSMKLVWGFHVTAKVKGEETGRRVAIFIFED